MHISLRIIALILLLLSAAIARQYKPDLTCDIIARVNNDFITKADYLNALDEYREELARQLRKQGRNDYEIDLEFERKKLTVIKTMIDDLLLDQRAAELRLDEDAEIRKIIENPFILAPEHHGWQRILDESLASQGIDLHQARASHRKRVLRHYVILREVLPPIIASVTDEERRDYYSKHKQQFILPDKVTISEVFISFEGRSETEAEYRARNLLTELRGGADFTKVVKENTPASRPTYDKHGQIGSFAINELKGSIANAIRMINRGEYTEPIRMTEGYMIIRLDECVAGKQRRYEDAEVQQEISRTIAMGYIEEEQKKYIAGLREKAELEICPKR